CRPRRLMDRSLVIMLLMLDLRAALLVTMGVYLEVIFLVGRRAKDWDRPKSSIGSVKIEEFSGDRRRYLKWRRAIEAQEQLYRLEAAELTMLVYLSTRGEARDVLDQVPLSDLTAPGGNVLLWKLLDESFGESCAELFERAERELNTYRRVPGQPIATHLANMRRLRAQYVRVDPDTTISDRAWAQRLLNRASLSKRERLDVYYSAGGAYTTMGIESALRHRCAQTHEDERRVPTPSMPSSRGSWSSRASSARPPSTSASSTASSRRPPFSRGPPKRNNVHLADELEDVDEEDLGAEEGDDLGQAPPEQEPEDDEMIEDEPPEEDDVLEAPSGEEATAEEVCEAFAAGWKAKAKTAGTRKARGWTQGGSRTTSSTSSRPPSSSMARSVADKKKSSTCSSCGVRGHWRGDPQCPNVLSGRDPPHRKPDVPNKGVNFVNYTFMVGGAGADPGSSVAPSSPWTTCPTCPSCFAAVTVDQKFCRDCGTKLNPKREWEVVNQSQSQEEQVPTRPMRDVRVPKHAVGKTNKPNDHTIKVRPQEAMAALDNMSREDKKQLRYLLEREEEEQQVQDQLPIRRGAGYESVPSMSSGTPWQSSAAPLAPTLPSAPPSTLRPPDKKDGQGRDKADGVRKRELEEFRITMWRRAQAGVRTTASSAAPVPTEKQARCRHEYDNLIWVANQHGHFARCKACDLKNVLYYSFRHGVLAAGLDSEPEPSARPLHAPGQVILDSGCRTAVAGWSWHRQFQAELRARGVTWKEIPEHETFQFGAGGPEVSTMAFVYPVGIYGKADLIRMSAVGGAAANCPGLVGPSELSRWGVCFDFAAKTLEVFGQRHAMTLSSTRHPALYILDLPGGDPWQRSDLVERAALLETSPQSLAFMVEGQETGEDEDVHEVLSSSSGASQPPEPHFFGDFGEAARKRKVQYWLGLLESDLGIKVIEALPDAEATGSEASLASSGTELCANGGSDGETITSHEFGLELGTEDENEASEFEEELVPDVEGKPCFFHKAKRQHVRKVAQDIKEASKEIGGVRALEPVAPVFFEECAQPAQLPPVRRFRRAGPWRMIEIFTVTMAVGMAACARGWEVGEPIGEPGFDLLQAADRERADGYLETFDPDFVMITWPSQCWRPLSTRQAEDARQCADLGRERAEQRKILAWIHQAVLGLRRKGVTVLGEAPWNSEVWREPLVIEAWAGLTAGRTELCAFGLRRPDHEWGRERGLHLRRPTRLVGDKEIVEHLCRACPGDHRHAPELGGVCVSGRWCQLGDLCGGYPGPFAAAIVNEIEKCLSQRGSRRRGEAFFVTPTIAEEAFLEEDQDFMNEVFFDEGTRDADMEPPAAADENHKHHNPDTENHDEEVESVDFGSQGVPDLEAVCDEDHKHHNPGTENHDEEGSTDLFDVAEHSPLLESLHMLHRRLGHPTNETLVRMLQHGGAKDDVIRMASELACPSCQLSKAPKRPFPARPEVRAVVFNTVVHLDLKYLKDFRGGIYVALSAVDEATNYHLAKLLRNREPAHVAAKFVSMWIAMFGPPQRVRLDQGGEWETEFIQLLEGHSILSEFVGSHAPWSNGFSERHGALLGVAVQANVDEKQLVGRSQMKLGLSCACQAKNSVISRGGHSAHYLVYGRQAAYPELLDDEVWSRKSLGFALSIEGEVARAAELRASAKVALLRGDVLEKIKRALRRAPTGERRQYMPGELIYFWSPASPRGKRYKRDLGSWRGPAVVLVPESSDRYFVSWRGRCLLLSGANMKGATVEDANRQDLRDEGLELEMAKGYVDMTEDGPPPVELEAPFSVEAPGLVSRRRANGAGRKLTDARRMMAGLKSVKKTLKLPLDPRQRRRLLPRRRRAEETVETRPPDDGQLVQPSAVEPADAPPAAPDSELPALPWEDAPAPPRDPNYDSLDDVPFQIKMKKRILEEGNEPEPKRVRTDDFANFVLTALSEKELNVKAKGRPRAEVARLGHLLDLPLSSARLHRAPRKRLQHPGPQARKARMTVMFGTDPKQALVAQETADEVQQRPARRCPHLWRGVSLFLSGSKGKGKKTQKAKLYLKKGGHTFVVNSDPATLEAAEKDLADYRAQSEAFLLKVKANGKELDPRHFSPAERNAFDAADEKEWQAWVKNKVVEEIDPKEAKKIPRARVFAIPARLVRTNKTPAGQPGLMAKSRIVLPGHLDPDIGSVRTDAPTTQMSAVRLAITLGMKFGWSFWLFDVSTAFLSGKAVDRDLYVQPPKDLKCVNPAVLWKILKSAYGLSEAPRLWYIQAKDLLKRCGFEEIPWVPATFLKKRQGKVVAMLCLHVDDGFLAGQKGREIEQAKKEINDVFSIKEWQNVGPEPRNYLGMKIYVKDGIFYNDMKDYVLEIRPPNIASKDKEALLDAAGLKEFRRLVAQLRWPVHLVMPEFLFGVSALAQRVAQARVKDLTSAGELLLEVQQAARKGQAVLPFKALKQDLVLVSYFDASLGKTSDVNNLAAQRGECHFVAEAGVLKGEAKANILEFHSNKIARVVRSSLAAEGASMAACADRLVYNLKLLDVIQTGNFEVKSTWRSTMAQKGHLVTDARSLFDHVKGSTMLATERQVSLDILEVRQLVQETTVDLHWVPTWKQYGDSLTKSMADELFLDFRKTNCINVVQSEADQVEEARRSGLRRAQRERRKSRMKAALSFA
ncbi:RE1, partial [Symbiodinium sp. KB8]